MEYTTISNNGQYEVSLKGKFVFFDHNRFHEILMMLADGQCQRMVLNLGGVEFIDSAALGMLLLAKDAADKHNVKLTIRQPNGQVAKMFHIAEFDTLFQMEAK